MLNTSDLHIADEIVPLFDSTFNFYSGKAVNDIITNPLASKKEINERQALLKGFIANRDLFKDYSFSRFNLAEIHEFLETFYAGSLSAGKLRWKLWFSEKEKAQKRGKLILLVRLFYKINDSYISKIKTQLFPPDYATELEAMKAFFAGFNLDHFEKAFMKNKFGVSHMVELMMLLTERINNGQLAAFWNRWFQFEAYLSISNNIQKNGFIFPVIGETVFSMEGIYHPLLKNPVKNDVSASKNVILLTGPNMSGKSTFLKSVSLCVYLGHTGLAVPASRAQMPFFDSISVAINLTDSIVSGYSHFMTEIVTLKNVLLEAQNNKRCFAVFDELFRGTNIDDALEISTATIKGLLKFPNSLFFISTHLHQLRNLEAIQTNSVATWYIDCILNGDTPAFTYQLKPGWSDLRVGRLLFEKEGLNKLLQT